MRILINRTDIQLASEYRMEELTSAHGTQPLRARRPAPSLTADAIYVVEAESLILQLHEPGGNSRHTAAAAADMSGLLDSGRDNASDAEGTLDENHRYSTVLLDKKAKKRRWCPSYRSADPDRTVTPFAVVLLAVLFAIYILNQADRLVLPVAIPSGLRCEFKEDDCRNLTSKVSTEDPLKDTLTGLFVDTPNASNTSNETDCIQFNDYEQGLLTGGC